MNKSIDEIRRELAGLIQEAVPEQDPARRQALLVLADHWSDIMRRRQTLDPDGGRASPMA